MTSDDLSPLDLLWVLLILSSLQPVLRKRWLDSQRQRAFHKLEQRRGSRVIGLIHRQETMALLGFPIACYIEDSEAVLRAMQLTDGSVGWHTRWPGDHATAGRASPAAIVLDRRQNHESGARSERPRATATAQDLAPERQCQPTKTAGGREIA